MLSFTATDSSFVPPPKRDEENKYSPLPFHPFDLDSSQVSEPPLVEEKAADRNIDELIQALVKGKGKTYVEKVQLAFKSSFLFLPLLFINGSFIFLENQARLETAMSTNLYYDHFFHKLIKTFSYEGGIVSAEAVGITTPSVILTNLITASALAYQGIKYLLNKKEMRQLLYLLKEKNYSQAEKILSYSLAKIELDKVRRIIEMDTLTKDTVIEADLSCLEKFTAELLWFQDQTHKYLAPLLPLSFIPGFLYMLAVANEIDTDMDCTMFSLWGLVLNVCPTLSKVELMSLLTYAWGFFSGTYLLSHSTALVSRLLMSPFPSLRRQFHEKINKPFAEWWEKDQHYNKLIKRSLLTLIMPPFAAFSLYISIQFTNTYLSLTGCSDISTALDKAFSFAGKPYPCSTTQATLGASVFIGEFEFNHLYPAYIATEALASLSTFIVKQLAYFQKEASIEKAKHYLARFVTLENKMMLALASGVLVGGFLGLWPSLQMANTILQKEGFELFFPLNNLPALTNLTFPALSEAQASSLEEVLNTAPVCSINTDFGLPDVHLGNTTISGFNASLPCIETFYDADSDTTILGLQVTAPCPDESIYSTFYRNLLHLPINCNPILVVRGFAGFVVPYWLSVNTGAAFSTTLAAAILLSVCALQAMGTPCQNTRPDPAQGNPAQPRRNYSPRLFSNTAERNALRLAASDHTLPALEDSSDEEVEDSFADEIYLNRHRSNCWSRLKTRLSQFFRQPDPASERPRGCQKPLLRFSRSHLQQV